MEQAAAGTTGESECASASASASESALPAWLSALLPMVPRPFESSVIDDESTEIATEAPLGASSASLFPSPQSVAAFLSAQSTRIDLLRCIRDQLRAAKPKHEARLCKYASLQLDRLLLVALSDVFVFSNSALELVHSASSAQLALMQRNNHSIMREILHVLSLMMRRQEMSLDADAPPLRVNVADRLSAHNSTELLCSMLERLVDDVAEHDAHRTDAGGGAKQLSDEPLKLLEGVLRCLVAQLDNGSADSLQADLKQLYVYIPSQHQAASIAGASPGQGSDSGILLMLIQLVKDRRSPAIVECAASVLSKVATHPIPNAHVHSSTCKKPPAPEACFRAVAPTPVITYPVHANSTLACAVQLFRFPADPSLYLCEAPRYDLLSAYLALLQKPASSHALSLSHGSPKLTAKPASRSLFQSSRAATNADSGGDDEARLPVLPASPASSLRRPALFHHDLHAEAGEVHHASLGALTEAKFMLAYTPCAQTPLWDDASSSLPQFPLAPMPAQPQSTPLAAAPLWSAASETLAVAALRGLAALCVDSTILSLHLCNQAGLLDFLASLLLHRELQLSLDAISLIASLERSLASAPRCESKSCTLLAHSDSPSLTDHLLALSKPRLTRRNSSESKQHSRRHSLGGLSPLQLPTSPAHKACVPPSFALIGQLPTQTSLTRTAAHALVAPLALRSVHFLLGVIQREWPALRSQMPKVPLDVTKQEQLLTLLSQLVAHLEEFQAAASPAIPVLASVLANKRLPVSTRKACIDLLASLCSLHAPNRTLVVEAGLLSVVLPMVANSHERAWRGRSAHPDELAMQLSVIGLASSLDNDFARYAARQIALATPETILASPIGCFLASLFSCLGESAPLSRRVLTMELAAKLLSPASPVRDLISSMKSLITALVKAGCGPTLEESCCAATDEGACFVTPSLGQLLRRHSLQALENATAANSAEFKRTLLAEIGFDALFELIASEDASGVEATEAERQLARKVAQSGLRILSNLLDQDDSLPVAVASVPADSAALLHSKPQLTALETARVLDFIERKASSGILDLEYLRLLSVLAQDEFSKNLICQRVLLDALHTALTSARDGAELAARCVANLLCASTRAAAVAVAPPQPDPGLIRRSRKIFSHAIFPSIAALAVLSDASKFSGAGLSILRSLLTMSAHVHDIPLPDRHEILADVVARHEALAIAAAGSTPRSSSSSASPPPARVGRRAQRAAARERVCLELGIEVIDDGGLASDELYGEREDDEASPSPSDEDSEDESAAVWVQRVVRSHREQAAAAAEAFDSHPRELPSPAAVLASLEPLLEFPDVATLRASVRLLFDLERVSSRAV